MKPWWTLIVIGIVFYSASIAAAQEKISIEKVVDAVRKICLAPSERGK